jgi:hypothetical protein
VPRPLPDAYEGEGDADEPVGPDISERSRGVALCLGFFGGFLGLHRFYAGKVGTGIAQICTLGGLGVWWLYDLVLLAAGEFRDMNDLRIRRWGVEPIADASSATVGQIRQLADQVDMLQREMGELAERLDFHERVLAQQKDRDRLLPGT